MPTHWKISSLALILLCRTSLGFDLDINSTDSIKGVAKTLASGLISAYNENTNNTSVANGTFAYRIDLPQGGFEAMQYPYWESGAAWMTLLQYAHLTGDTQHNAAVSTALMLQAKASEAWNFVPKDAQWKAQLSNFDQSTWGLAALTAAEIGLPDPQTDGVSWAGLAVNVFREQVARWETDSCPNGLRGRISKPSANADDSAAFQYHAKTGFANGGFFLLAARLARFTGNATYAQWAEKAFDWAQSSGVVTSGFGVVDIAVAYADWDKEPGCKFESKEPGYWSVQERDRSLFTEGAAVMYNITNATDKWRTAISGFANASCSGPNCATRYNNTANTTDFILRSYCEEWAPGSGCPAELLDFKGLVARSYARAAALAPALTDRLARMIRASAPGAAKNCVSNGTDVNCGLEWTGRGYNFYFPAYGGPVDEVYGALEVVQGLLWPQAEALRKGNASSGVSSGGGSSGGGSKKSGAEATVMLIPGSLLAAFVIAVLFI